MRLQNLTTKQAMERFHLDKDYLSLTTLYSIEADRIRKGFTQKKEEVIATIDAQQTEKLKQVVASLNNLR